MSPAAVTLERADLIIPADGVREVTQHSDSVFCIGGCIHEDNARLADASIAVKGRELAAVLCREDAGTNYIVHVRQDAAVTSSAGIVFILSSKFNIGKDEVGACSRSREVNCATPAASAPTRCLFLHEAVGRLRPGP